MSLLIFNPENKLIFSKIRWGGSRRPSSVVSECIQDLSSDASFSLPSSSSSEEELIPESSATTLPSSSLSSSVVTSQGVQRLASTLLPLLASRSNLRVLTSNPIRNIFCRSGLAFAFKEYLGFVFLAFSGDDSHDQQSLKKLLNITQDVLTLLCGVCLFQLETDLNKRELFNQLLDHIHQTGSPVKVERLQDHFDWLKVARSFGIEPVLSKPESVLVSETSTICPESLEVLSHLSSVLPSDAPAIMCHVKFKKKLHGSVSASTPISVIPTLVSKVGSVISGLWVFPVCQEKHFSFQVLELVKLSQRCSLSVENFLSQASGSEKSKSEVILELESFLKLCKLCSLNQRSLDLPVKSLETHLTNFRSNGLGANAQLSLFLEQLCQYLPWMYAKHIRTLESQDPDFIRRLFGQMDRALNEVLEEEEDQ